MITPLIRRTDSRRTHTLARIAGVVPALAAAVLALASGACRSQPDADEAAGAAMTDMTGATALDVIAFGSCARERDEQPVWDTVLAKNPDLFLFIGDNMYADTREKNADGSPLVTREVIAAGYADLGAQPGWQKLTAACHVMATWDDHDYGKNDGGEEFELKREATAEFLAFFGELPGREPSVASPVAAPVAESVAESDDGSMADAADALAEAELAALPVGVYNSKVFGPEGRRVQVIMLDTRTFRSGLTRDDQWREKGLNGPYRPNPDGQGSMLGDEQWAWLEAQLAVPADVRIIASSIQVVADEHGWEGWGNMPHERRRLYDLIDAANASGVVFISGDRHLMELSLETEGPYDLWDFTSSGMTQDTREVSEPNRHRFGPVLRTTNFGIIRIDWQDELTKIRLEGYGVDGQRLTTAVVPLYTLRKG